MNRPRKTPVEAVIDIHDFSYSGEGLAHYSPLNKAPSLVEAPYTVPGDQARVCLLKKRAGVYESRLLAVDSPSPARIPPACSHFGACGGCSWQQISYEDQLKQKQDWIQTRFSEEIASGTHLQPILASHPWNYRNKMEFTFSRSPLGEDRLGLYKAKTRGWVVNLNECHLAPDWFSDALELTRQWWKTCGLLPYHPSKNTGSLRTLTLREGKRSLDRMLVLTISGNPDFPVSQDILKAYVESIKEQLTPLNAALSIYLCEHKLAKGTPTELIYTLLHGPAAIREEMHLKNCEKPLIFNIGPRAFFQPNTLQAEILYQKAVEMADITEHSTVYDLFCGTGTIGMFAARKAKKVIGIEINEEAVQNAKKNLCENQLENMEIYQGDVGHFLSDNQQQLPHPDVIIVDPPRSGLDPKTLQHLLSLQAEKILYISCNPATQTNNVKDLIKQGYQLVALQPVDQFPHTPHIENIALLRRS